MRVAHVITSIAPGSGGTVSALLRMGQAQARAGLEVTFVARTISETDELRATLACGIQLSTLSRWITSPPSFDLIHVHGLWDRGLPTAGRLARQLTVPFVVSPHGMATTWAVNQGRLKKQLYTRAVLRLSWPRSLTLHFATEWERVRSMGWWPHPSDSIVVPLAVDVDAICAASTRSRERLTLMPEPAAVTRTPRTLLFVGRVHPGKGLEYLIPAMRNVPPELGRLHIVGPNDSPFARTLRSQADALGIAERIDWVGPVYAPELYAKMGDAAALVLPSDHENFGLVAVESLAAGTPALLSREVAIGEALVHSGAASWVSREPDELGKELVSLLREPSRLALMTQHCRQAVEPFGLDRLGIAWKEAYSGLVEKSGSEGFERRATPNS